MVGPASQVRNTHIRDVSNPQQQQVQNGSFGGYSTSSQRILNTALTILTLGLFDLVKMAINSYKAKQNTGNLPRVAQQKILQHNLAILDSEFQTGIDPYHYGIKEAVADEVRKKLSELGGPDSFIYMPAAIKELRKDIQEEQKKMSSQRYADLLTGSLTQIILKQHLQAEVQAKLQDSGLTLPNNSIDLLIGLNAKDFRALEKTTNPTLVKTKFDHLVQSMYTSAFNLTVQAQVIDECMMDGFRSLLRSLDLTPQQTLLIPRAPIVAYLENIATKVEDNLKVLNDDEHILTTPQDYQDVQRYAAQLFGSLIHVGVLAKAKTGDTAVTADLLAKTLMLFTPISRSNIPILMSSPDPSVALDATVNLYSSYLEHAPKVFGQNNWDALPQNQKDIFLSMVIMLLKFEDQNINNMSNNRPLLESLEAQFHAEGLQAAANLAGQRPTSPNSTKIRRRMQLLSGGLNITKSIMGGKGFGLE